MVKLVRKRFTIYRWKLCFCFKFKFYNPKYFFENEDIDLNFFIDFANVWEVDYNDSLDSNKIRSSTGIAFNWFSPIGPFTFSYAIPLSEASTDITEKFRFQIGTSF